jgi:hypothetical protein
MRVTVVLEIEDESGSCVTKPLITVHRDGQEDRPEDVGLTLEEAKTLLRSVQSELVSAQTQAFCAVRRACPQCGERRQVHDYRRRRVHTIFGSVHYESPRWRACRCERGTTQSLCPLSELIPEKSTPELRWLNARLGAMLPYRQAATVLRCLLPVDRKHNHVTVRNHTLRVGAELESAPTVTSSPRDPAAIAEVGIDVGYVRRVRGQGAANFAIVAAAVGRRGEKPRVWAATRDRAGRLSERIAALIKASGSPADVRVNLLSDAADDLKRVSHVLPHNARHVLDWAHIGRMLHHIDQALLPIPHGHITEDGPFFQLWDLFVRFRNSIWIGAKRKIERQAEELVYLLQLAKYGLRDAPEDALRRAISRVHVLMDYLRSNRRQLIDYRRWKKRGLRISTAFVESTINRVIGRRMGKLQQMRWTRPGAHDLLQVRCALANQELDDRFLLAYPNYCARRVSWPLLGAPHGS